jgi:hypothetical protein
MKYNWKNTSEDFEQFLQTEAESYRAYPSDKVWDNIREELHGKPKWPALIFIFSSIVLALTVATIYNYPPQKFILKSNISVLQQQKPVSPSLEKAYNVHSMEKRSDGISGNILFISPNPTKALPAKDDATAYIVENTVIQNETIANKQQQFSKVEAIVFNNSVSSLYEINKHLFGDKYLVSSNLDNASMNLPRRIIANNPQADKKVITCNDDVNNYLKNFKMNSVTKQEKKSNWQLQYYATVSNSYRVLEDDKTRLAYTTNTTERQALKNNVNDIVKQRPAVGGELGIAFLRKLSNNFYIKTGFQFNIRQYGTDAYRAKGDAKFSYVKNNQLNSFSLKSSYTTQAGSTSPINLDNTLYQISVPIGVQWNVAGGERWGLSVAATIQPTVTLNKNVYVVSTDYKYYADGTSFFRRLNVNTSTELYLTLKSKNIQWFFGPQIRYQQMPTFNDIYPIKEYRVDYGIKFGFTKPL